MIVPARHLWAAFALASAILAGANLRAQPMPEPVASPMAESPMPMPAPSPAAPEVEVRERQPSIYFAPDASGQLRPVLNLPLERVERLLDAEGSEPADARPQYTLDFTAQGNVVDQQATLEIECQVRLTRDGWVRVPLRLDEALVVPGSVRHEGPGEHLLVPDPQGRGYLCWLRGAGEEPHRIRLTVAVRVESVGDELRAKLSTPLATSTVVTLRVPGADLIGRAPDDAILETTADDNGPSTIFKSICGRAPFELTWWKRSTQEVALPALEASGAIFAQISGHVVEETATLNVRSLDQPFNRFRVRLPAGAVLKSGSGHNYAAIETATSGESEDDPSGWIYEIQLDRPVRQAEVRLVSERNDIPDGAAIELAGFELLEARRQAGHLAVAVVGDWQLIWGDDLNVHRVTEAELPAELRGKPILAAFEYVAQPSSLQARVTRRQPRRVAESSLVFQVEAERVRLDAQFKFNVSGARVSELELNWPEPGWVIEEIGPATLVDSKQLTLDERTPLVIPLAQPTQGELEITLRASRRRSDDERRIELSGPAPVAELLKPSLFAVAAVDNIRVTPKPDELQGLTRQPAVFLKNLPNLQQEALCYRAEQEAQRFVGEAETLPQSVSVDVATTIRGEARRWQVDQRFAYQIQHEPLSQIEFEIPNELAQAIGQLSVALDAQPVPVAGLTTKELDRDTSLLEVALPAPRIGPLVVTLSFPWQTADTEARAFPLASPLGFAPKRHQATVQAGDAAELALRDDAWRPATTRSAAANSLVVETREPATSLNISVRQTATLLTDPFLIERCWLQTRLTANQRYDRAVFRLSTNRARLELQLPPRTDLATVQTWLDGQLVASRIQGQQRLAITLPPSTTTGGHVIEVVYQCASDRGALRRPNLDPPMFLAAGSPRLTYWELTLPTDRVLLLDPVDFHSEMDWTWNRFYWRRQPHLAQSQLEVWSGARREATASSDEHRYLFSVLGAPGALSPQLMDRSTVILVASGIVLSIGLLLLQVPALRHPAFILVLLTALLAAALLRLDAALLLAQAAGVGLVLLAISALLKWALSTRRRPVVVVRRAPSSIIERGSTRSEPPLASAAGSNSSTKTTSIPVELAGESKS